MKAFSYSLVCILKKIFLISAGTSLFCAAVYAAGSHAVNDASVCRHVSETSNPSLEFASPLERWWRGDRLTGNWFGYRTQLEETGVNFFASYEQDFAGNPYGGLDQGATNSGSIEFGVLFDLEKLVHVDDTTLLVRVVDRNGRDLSGKYIGNFFPVQQDFGSETVMLQSIAFEKKFFDGAFSVKLGRVATGDDFASSPLYGLYMTNAIDGTPKSLAVSGAFSCYPGTVWGGRALFVDPQKQWYAKAGVYQASNRIYKNSSHGVDFGIRKNDGLTFIAEAGWTPEFFQRAITDKSGKMKTAGLPGHYWVGAYCSWWDIEKFDGTGTKDFSYVVYWHADQMIFQPDCDAGTDKGLTLWGLFNLAPQESIQVMPYQVSAGLAYKGAIPGRNDDRIIFGASYGNFSDEYSSSREASGDFAARGETVFELAYAAQLNAFTVFQPDIQYVLNPAGSDQIRDALVLGIRLKVVF